MLKSVSSIINAIGALNYKGTWNASTNTPTIVSSVGVKGDYYVVSVAGTTTIDSVSNWGVGDWITFNGSVWQRVEGGADLNGVNLSVSGTTTLSGLTASTALALNASKEMVSVTNTGTGDNVLATTPTLVGDVTLSTGNLVVSDGKGIDFSATPGTGTSELFDDYEEGAWTPVLTCATAGDLSVTYSTQTGTYVKVGRLVTATCVVSTSAFTHSTASGDLRITGIPFTAATAHYSNLAFNGINKATYTTVAPRTAAGSSVLTFLASGMGVGSSAVSAANTPSGGTPAIFFTLCYETNS